MAAFYVCHTVLPTPLSPTPEEEAAITLFHLLHDQIRHNAPLGASPFGLLPTSVTVQYSPTMPIGYERWTPAPAYPPAVKAAYTCLEVTVDPDCPAAHSLYRLATNQLPAHTIPHPPTGDPYIDRVLQTQPLLVTRAPGNPPPATGPRITVACPAF